jgi:hypothetical protein
VFLPGEVATPILDQRPNPVGPEERARMVQPQDCADLMLYIVLLPKRLTMNEVMLSPTWNRAYVAAIRQLSKPPISGNCGWSLGSIPPRRRSWPGGRRA